MISRNPKERARAKAAAMQAAQARAEQRRRALIAALAAVAVVVVVLGALVAIKLTGGTKNPRPLRRRRPWRPASCRH